MSKYIKLVQKTERNAWTLQKKHCGNYISHPRSLVAFQTRPSVTGVRGTAESSIAIDHAHNMLYTRSTASLKQSRHRCSFLRRIVSWSQFGFPNRPFRYMENPRAFFREHRKSYRTKRPYTKYTKRRTNCVNKRKGTFESGQDSHALIARKIMRYAPTKMK